ncbi:antibiotic biosynthesis monooxygenase [Microcoleus sp. herbarium12]|uniref:antibiotic biosynthesis monooxygenase n=1 Tax=Microcoleus sp. herbarium12 TaxID=3055437 RepID=UPI002FD49F4F
MLQNSPEVQNSDTNEQVTAVISHQIKPGREQGYEEWLKGIAADAKRFEGHCGVSIIRPRDGVCPEYVAILKFDRYTHLKQWIESDVRQQWLDRLEPLISKPEEVQTLTGLETWFTLSGQPRKSPPPRYKMALVTWLGVFVTVGVLSRFLPLILSAIPPLLSQIISSGLTVALLTYLVMPQLTRLFSRWLYPK